MARKKFKMEGMDKFMKNMNKEAREIEGRTHVGLINAVIVLQRSAEPGTPVDTSNLRHSWFTVSYNSPGNIGPSPEGESFKGPDASDMRSNHSNVKQAAHSAARSLGGVINPVLIFGYSANYAAWVHENLDAQFKRPGAHARWLYKAIQQKRAEMLEEIRKHAQIR